MAQELGEYKRARRARINKFKKDYPLALFVGEHPMFFCRTKEAAVALRNQATYVCMSGNSLYTFTIEAASAFTDEQVERQLA